MEMRIQSFTLSGIIVCAALAGVTALSTGCAGTSYRRSTGTYLDDKGITTRIKTDLFRDPVVSGFDVHVNTFRGNVQLSGFVDTPEQKQRASDIARSVEGVQSVSNELEVKPGTAMGAPGANVQTQTQTVPGTPPPENAAPNYAPPPNNSYPANTPPPTTTTVPGAPVYTPPPNVQPPFHSNVEISTVNGRAILRGTVATESERQSIEKKIRDIPGIQSVDNELQVLQPR
jgi:hyperosmotically inducible protein